jgi:peptidyl-prolyl cis-trans isomerase-like 2
MGKKQHQKDRLFLTSKEWKEEWGGHKDKAQIFHQRLPFNCCAISFTPFEDPVCTEDGTVFDVTNIVPYISKHHSHPVTGGPLKLGHLIPITFHKNADGEYECPILKKVFTRVCDSLNLKLVK